MKKLACLLLILSCLFGLTSCITFAEYPGVERSYLEGYILDAKRGSCGHSSLGIDRPPLFVPPPNFFDEFEYIEGEYYWWSPDDILGLLSSQPTPPEIAILYLKYDKETYLGAKEYMLETIEPYSDKYYYHKSYIFYENSNFHEDEDICRFPEWTTMAGFNDQSFTLIFLGVYIYLDDDSKYKTDLEENFGDFLEECYGEHYDFSK